MRKGYKILLIGVFIGIYLFLTAWLCVPLIKAWPFLSSKNQVIGKLPDLKPIMALYKNPLICLLELRDTEVAIPWLVISSLIVIAIIIWIAWERWNERVLHPTEKKTKRPKVHMPNHTADATAIGISDNGKPVYIPDNARHIFVAGTTGSGKTIALSNFFESGLTKGYGMLIIDGKGDTGPGSLMDYCCRLSIRYGRRIHIIGGPSPNAKYNPFRNANETEAKDMLISMTDWSEPHYRFNTERYVQSLIRLLLIAGIPLSYDVVIKSMSKTAYETLSAQLVRENKITKEDHIANLAISAASSDITASATARFATIAEGEGNSIFSADGIDVYTALSKGDIIFFCLSPLLYPSFASSLGRLAVLDARKAVSRMWGDHKPKFFIFDELGAYISPMFITLLSQARAATVTCIAATQSFADLDMVSTSLRRQVVENCNSFVMMRQNSPEDAQQAADIIGTHEDMDITYQLNEQKQTGLGSARKVRQYFFHPDVIKNLCVGEAVFVSKETGQRTKLWVRKPE
ncbi:MAG: hypothetical protein PWP48_1752 [Clostridiales bacterium]|jgi:hypothetical protein|nr:hypothetical protein [Clostridiales bacterium]